jgi:uncharacterized protein YegP (UPF0339 family)
LLSPSWNQVYINIKILEQYTLTLGTTDYVLQIFSDEDGLFSWRVMYGDEEVGTCNQGYKSKSSVISNIKKQAAVLSLFNDDLTNEIE